jgi:membrane protease YdiL (CAAX protease family)
MVNRVIHIIIPILLALIGAGAMLLLSHLLNAGQFPVWKISAYEAVNITFTMQMIVLLVSFLVLTLMFFYRREQFKLFFRWSGPPSTDRASWNGFGPMIALAFTMGTLLFMSAGAHAQHGAMNAGFFRLLPLVLLFAATNAWSEEIFTRFVIVTGLYGKLNPTAICWISAIVFGGPHFLGTPSGLFGVLMAGLMGWFLARSVIDTKGMGWALFIHFLQDLVIFGAGAMVLAATQ